MRERYRPCALQVPDHWAWDSWVADDGECYTQTFRFVLSGTMTAPGA
jgi:hypothetical protein